MASPSTRPSFQWDDPFLIEGQLTDDERMVRDAAQAFAKDELLPRVQEAFRHETTDPKIFRSMGELGLLGATIPDSYGGAGLNYVCYGLIAREVERVDSGYRSMMSVQSSLVMVPIFEFGTEATKQKYLPKLATGRMDRLLRPDRAQPRLRPRRHGHARAQGRRAAIASRARRCGSPTARSPTCSSSGRRTTPARSAASCWRRAGRASRAPAIHGKVGLRASITGEIVLDDVFCPEENAFPEVRGLKGPFTCLNSARYGIAWGALGAAEDCFARARQYVLDRKQFGRPLAANQLIQKKLADMQTEIALGLQGCLRLGRMKDEGAAPVELTSILKRNNCGKALDIARMARDMMGGNGISDEFGVARHLVNLEVVNTYEGTHDIHALILGRAITGIPAFS